MKGEKREEERREKATARDPFEYKHAAPPHLEHPPKWPVLPPHINANVVNLMAQAAHTCRM